MSKSTPADLAVAFRSLERRRREALDAADGAPIDSLLSELNDHITAAATLVGAAGDAAAIASALVARPADKWDNATLDAVRDHATSAGSVLRRVADAAPAPARDGADELR